MRKYVYMAICIALAVFFFAMKEQAWILFGGLAVYFLFRRGHSSPSMPRVDQSESIVYGVLGKHVVSGDSELSYGLFIDLDGDSVFVDIKEDAHFEERKRRAIFLFERRKELEKNISKFRSENPSFKNKKIHAIGIHAEDLEQGEVFWIPDGYTLLKGLEFLPD